MKLYPENYEVSIDFLFTDLNGAPVTVSLVNAALWDGDDEVVANFGSVAFNLPDGKVTVTVPAAFNVLGAGELSAVRVLRVEMVTPAGTIRRSASYIIDGETRLEVMNNTFMSLEAADALARDIPNLTGWLTADAEKRSAALINAYSRLIRIQMQYFVDVGPVSLMDSVGDLYNVHCGRQIVLNATTWSTITKDDFLEFPKLFRQALRQAQLVEANAILTDNPIEARHRAGVISETVGESSIMLRGNRLELGVSAESLRYLTGFVYYNWVIGRR